MQKPKVEVIPYLCGRKLHVAVYVCGEEVFEGEQDLAILFKHFSEVVNPMNAEHEAEAYALLDELEAGIDTINNVLGD